MAKEILIADSDKADQEEFQRIFETTDYRLIFSESGEEALLRVKLFKPDLIIAAAGLSEKNGLELCEDIRSDAESKHIPFILLSSILGEISERDCKRVKADGIISKPLHEVEILNLVQRLIEEEALKKKEKGISEREMERRPFADIRRANPGKKEDLLLDEPAEDEIIELVDVVEEPETKMSIDDFVHPEKEEPLGELAPFESWERLEEMVRPEERTSLRKFKPPVTGFKLSPEEEDEVETEEMLLQLEKEIAPKPTSGKEVEFFEKIELEEILEKVEQLKPSIEKEWPQERERAPVEEAKAFEEVPPTSGEVEEKYSGLEEFEAALKWGVKHLGEEVQPFIGGELKVEAPKEAVKEPKIEAPREAVTEEMMVEELGLEELAEEAFREEEEAEPRKIWPEEIRIGEIAPEEIRPKAVVPQEIAPEEAMPEEIRFEEIGLGEEEAEPQKIWPEEIRIGEIAPEEIRPKAVVPQEIAPEEARPEEIRFEEIGLGEEEAEPQKIWPEEIGIGEIVPEEIRPKAIVPEEIAPEEARPEEIRAEEIRIDRFEKAEAPRIFEEEIGLPLRRVDRQVEEIIAKGVREMMQEFLTKLLPEMTQNIIGLTLDRIEKMVREIVPDLAEKAIQEEIKRLQKGEKD